MTDLEQRSQLADLTFLHSTLEAAGIEAILVPRGEQAPLTTVLIPDVGELNGHPELPPLSVQLNFIELDESRGLKLLQFYANVPLPEEEAELAFAYKTKIMGEMTALGHFSIRDAGDLYYRYVHAIPLLKLPDENTFINLTELILDSINRAYDIVAEN